MNMAQRNIIAGTVLLMVAIGYGILTANLPDRSLPDTPGPAFLPTLITIGLLVLSVALLVGGVIEARQESKGTDGHGVPTRGWIALAGFAVYVTLLPSIGFVAASVLFFAGLMWLYGERNKILIGLTSILVPVVLFYLFTAGFQILLPRSPL